jgi:hypothetical protein
MILFVAGKDFCSSGCDIYGSGEEFHEEDVNSDNPEKMADASSCNMNGKLSLPSCTVPFLFRSQSKWTVSIMYVEVPMPAPSTSMPS